MRVLMLLSVLTLTFGLGLSKTYLIETAGSGHSKHVRRANPEPEKYHGADYAAAGEESAHHDTDASDGPIEGCLDPVTNVTHKIGESFKVDCNTCKCLDGGKTACTERACPPPIEGCFDPVTNVTLEVDESFTSDCNTCWCIGGGNIACTLILCPPRIEECLDPDTNVTYKTGESFKDDCNTCKCNAWGIIACTEKPCSIEECFDPVTNVTYKIGESFKDDCNECECKDGGYIACTKIGCWGLLPANYSCIDDNGIHRYQEGERYTAVNGCQKEVCTCKQGKLDCESYKGETHTSVNGCLEETCTCNYGHYDCERSTSACHSSGVLFTKIAGDVSHLPECQADRDGIQGCWKVSLDAAKLGSLGPNDRVQFSDQEPAFIIELRREPSGSDWKNYHFLDVDSGLETTLTVRTKSDGGISVVAVARSAGKIFGVERCREKGCLVMKWVNSDYFNNMED